MDAPQISQNFIHSVAISVTSGMFATTQTGVQHSLDAGRTWQPISDRIPVTALLIQPDLIIAGAVGHMLASQDAGKTWTKSVLPVSNTTVSALAACNHALIAATAEDGVLLSDDQGKTWRGWNFGLHDWRVLSLVVTPDRIVLCGTESGIYRSTNGGRSWDALPEAARSAILTLTVAPFGDLYAGTEDGLCLYSSDNGHTWVTLHQLDQSINGLAVSADRNLAIIHGTTLNLVDDDDLHPVATGVTAVTWATRDTLLVGMLDGQLRLIGSKTPII